MDKHTEEVRPNSSTIKTGTNGFLNEYLSRLKPLGEMLDDGFLLEKHSLSDDTSVELEVHTCVNSFISSKGPWEALHLDCGEPIVRDFAFENIIDYEPDHNDDVYIDEAYVRVFDKGVEVMSFNSSPHRKYWLDTIKVDIASDRQGRILCSNGLSENSIFYDPVSDSWLRETTIHPLGPLGAKDIIGYFLSPPPKDKESVREILLLGASLRFEPIDKPSGITLDELEKHAEGISSLFHT